MSTFVVPKFNKESKKNLLCKSISFRVHLAKMSFISNKNFKHLNWLPVHVMFEEFLNSTMLKFVNGSCPVKVCSNYSHKK